MRHLSVEMSECIRTNSCIGRSHSSLRRGKTKELLVQEEISQEVDQFVRNHITSVEQLEVLLLLMENSSREWSAIEVAQKLYRQPQSVAIHLEALKRNGLLSQSSGGTISYQYNPKLVATAASVRALGKAYRERKDTVIRLIFSNPPNTLP